MLYYPVLNSDWNKCKMYVKNINDEPWLMTADAYAIYAQCLYKPVFEEYQEEITKLTVKQECSIFACLHNEQFAGIIALEKTSSDTAEIISIAVKKELQRRGIGKYMVRFAAQALNVNFLTVETDNESVGFYNKSGFLTTPFIRHFPDADVTRYNCVLEINS